jgi:hypothetical protein
LNFKTGLLFYRYFGALKPNGLQTAQKTPFINESRFKVGSISA